MDGTLVTAVVLMVLFPGVLALKIFDGMTEVKKRSEFDKIAIAVGFSLAVYFAYLGVSFWWSLPHIPVRYDPNGIWPIKVNSWGVLAVFLLTICLAYLSGNAIDRGWFARLNWKGWLTTRSIGGPPTVWVDAFNAYRDKWVRVYLKDGRILQGPLECYSDDPEYPGLFLGRAFVPDEYREKAIWQMDANGRKEYVHGPGILITQATPISHIVFQSFLIGR